MCKALLNEPHCKICYNDAIVALALRKHAQPCTLANEIRTPPITNGIHWESRAGIERSRSEHHNQSPQIKFLQLVPKYCT